MNSHVFQPTSVLSWVFVYVVWWVGGVFFVNIVLVLVRGIYNLLDTALILNFLLFYFSSHFVYQSFQLFELHVYLFLIKARRDNLYCMGDLRGYM